MKKPESLKAYLLQKVPHVRDNPNDLHIFIEKGQLVSSLVKRNLSFEYQYSLNVLITNYTGDTNLLMVPIFYWLRQQQTDAFTVDNRDNSFTFEVDILNEKESDIDIYLSLTERVIVKEVNGKMNIEYAPEPSEPDYDRF